MVFNNSKLNWQHLRCSSEASIESHANGTSSMVVGGSNGKKNEKKQGGEEEKKRRGGVITMVESIGVSAFNSRD